MVSNAPKQFFFVFTENSYCLSTNSKRVGGGQAVIRGLPRTMPICTKERYVYMEKRSVASPPFNKDYTDLALFQKHNIPLLEQIEIVAYDKTKCVILPRQYGGHLAYMPQSCASWLCFKLNDLCKAQTYRVCTNNKGSYIKAIADCL
jgi:hypothetical protein